MKFHVLTEFRRPGLHIWEKSDSDFPLRRYLHPVGGQENGWWRFETEPDQNPSIGCKLFEWNQELNKPQTWESSDDTFIRTIMLGPGETLPDQVFLIQGSARILFEDPRERSISRVRIHLITKKAFLQSQLYVWVPGKSGSVNNLSGEDIDGPYFDLNLETGFQNCFNFKFVKAKEFEPDYSNRTWSCADGAEIWTHSKGAAILRSKPMQKQLTVHLRHEWGNVPVKMHLWQETSDFETDFDGTVESDGWVTFQTEKNLYTGIPYGFMFFKPGWQWKEDKSAERYRKLSDDEECWTLEGSNVQFAFQPKRDHQVVVEIIGRAPECGFTSPDDIQVKVDQALVNLPPQFERRGDGTWAFFTYPDIVTSFRFSLGKQQEPVYHKVIPTFDGFKTYVLLGRAPCLFDRPHPPLFVNPPYWIKRPGVIAEDGYLRFAIHAQWCSKVQLKGQWQQTGPVELQSTADGNFWWIQIPISEIKKGLGKDDYHGAWYQYVLNDASGGEANSAVSGAKNVQDPAAGWVSGTHPTKDKSKLVNHSNYVWKSTDWETPGWEYLSVYEVHPARFTNRNGLKPFAEIAKEIESGYLRDLGFSAVLLMPSSEFPGDGWGYNPSYYYAAKDSYGGPDELKRLVDVCHQHGFAVLLDVIFNHAGTGDNLLWVLDKNTYFDGDTAWGAMINFSNDISKDFFAKCLVYWNREYHIDGFRFDMTNPIIEGHTLAPFVRTPNIDNDGWFFLHHLRQALKSSDWQCLMMAEQFPNNYGLTNYGGPMDTQWLDDFHDRLLEICRGRYEQMSRFADALKISHTACQRWYNVTPYPSSHDDVGNGNDRISNTSPAYYGRGLRINKVAATASLMARGIPMFFMGEESGESGQFFQDSDDTLNLEKYETDTNCQHVRSWWQTLLKLRKNNPKIQGPSPIEVHYVDGPVIAFSRGEVKDYFIVLNFGDMELSQSLGVMNLPYGTYIERWNSTYPSFQVEWENEFRNWGELRRERRLNIPDNGAVILERLN